MEMISSLIVGTVLGLIFGLFVFKKKPQNGDCWKLLHYLPYNDTSYGNRVASCRFTVVEEKSQKVYNRICYGKMYSQGEIINAMKLNVAHKLGEKDNLN